MSSSAMPAAGGRTPQRTFMGHPIGLYILFFTEMWERFSYYGMRALLVLYMVDYFKMTQEDASGIYKWYTSLVYLTPLMGGFLADRYLGNKWSIIIGALLMAVGHFLMAFEAIWIFYTALGFLIIGNGFFKPNMSVQVGRLYPQNDPRRDGAYTIFYMGINLGAFLSPFVCGALKDTPSLGFHWGFGAAGVGMVLGLVVYVLGLPFIKEVPSELEYEPAKGENARDEKTKADDHAMTEEEAETSPSVMPGFTRLAPSIFKLVALMLVLGAPLAWWAKVVSLDNAIALEIAAVACFIGGWILSHLSMAVRDRVLAIYALFAFVVFFWAAFEQAGNAMNVWADQTTNRFLTEPPATPTPYPSVFVSAETQGFGAVFKEAVSKPFKINPVLTTSFQSINAAAIVFMAPLFAWLWLFLARKHINLSIATKMAIGVFLMGMAFALMVWAGKYENQPCSTQLAALPEDVIKANEKEGNSVYFYDAPEYGDDEALERFQSGKPDDEEDEMIAHGGRLIFDESEGALNMRGVLNSNHRDRILRATSPKWYVQAIWDLTEKTIKAKDDAVEVDKDGKKVFSVDVQIDKLPEGFDAKYLQGFDPNKFRFDEATRTFHVSKALADKDYKQILVAGADPIFRDAVNDLSAKSAKFKVSSWWLFWFYILATLGELCLSPVGLSMVSKLAPKRFATMLMGIWLLTSFFGNFVAGLAGENWEFFEPGTYFTYIALALVAASFVCYLIARKVTSMMHGVK